MHKKVFLILLILLCPCIIQPADSLNDIKAYAQENPGNLSVICSAVSIAAMLYDYNINYPKWYNKTYIEELDILNNPMGLDNYLGVYLIGFKGTVPAKALKIVATIMAVAAGIFTYKWRHPALVPPPHTPQRPRESGVFSPSPSQQTPLPRSSLSSLPPPLQPVTPPPSTLPGTLPQTQDGSILRASPTLREFAGDAAEECHERGGDESGHELRGIDGTGNGSKKPLLGRVFDDPFGCVTSTTRAREELPAAAPRQPVGTPRAAPSGRRPSVATSGQGGRRVLAGQPVGNDKHRGSSVAARATDIVAGAQETTVAALDAMLLQIRELRGEAKENLIQKAGVILNTLRASGQAAKTEIDRLTEALRNFKPER